jgi:hypothetical protein
MSCPVLWNGVLTRLGSKVSLDDETMNPLKVVRKAFRVSLVAITAVAITAAGSDKQPPTYQKGTITGWNTQHSTVTGAATGRSIPTHKEVYDLKGPDATYQIDDCGAFSTGKFQVGQAVDYRADGKKIYIRKEDGSEQKCKIEGVKTEGTPATP